MTVREIVEALEAASPLSLAEDWDNVGLQIGEIDGPANVCLLAVDVTRKVLQEAKRCGAGLIISHHPLIFSPMRSVTDATPAGELLLSAARLGVAVYAAHTNLDCAPQIGTAAALCQRLGLERGAPMVPSDGSPRLLVGLTGPSGLLSQVCADCGDLPVWNEWGVTTAAGEGESERRREMFLPTTTGATLVARARSAGLRVHAIELAREKTDAGLGMVCVVPQMSLEALAEYVHRKLGPGHMVTAGNPVRKVTRVALVPGSGGSLVSEAARVADAMVTGEIKYHDAQQACDLGLGVVAAGHYDTERPVLDLVAKYLKRELRDGVEVAISQERTDPFWPVNS